MVDLSTYPFPTYIPNRIIAGMVSSFVFLSLIVWLIQSIQNHFQPIRVIILLLLSHLMIFSELIIRNMMQQNSRIFYITMTILYTIGQRSIIVANFTCLIQFSEKKSNISRWIFLLISITIILSDILMTPAGLLSFNSNKIYLSFLFRQLSTSILSLIALLFYIIWFYTRTYFHMSYELILLLIISSFNSLIVTIFLFIMSFPSYYIQFNNDEQWFYMFQILPIVLTLCAWSMLHPKRSFYLRNQLTIANDDSAEKKIQYAF